MIKLEDIAKDKKVLVVEDEDLVGKITLRLLDKLGFQKIDLAVNESQAMEFLSSNQYDLIMADTNLGPISAQDQYGPRIVREARKKAVKQPIVLATSAIEDNKRFWVGESQADAFLLKPYGLTELKEKIENVLGL